MLCRPGLSCADTGPSTPCPARSASRGLAGYPSGSITSSAHGEAGRPWARQHTEGASL